MSGLVWLIILMSQMIYLLQMFWVIDLIVNIRHHLQGATQWWNRLPVIRETAKKKKINSGETLAANFQTSSRRCNYHDAMMTLRDSSTSAAVSLCWGSNTSSFRIRHTVFSDTRPSLWGGGGGGGGAGRENFICKTWLWVTSPQSQCWKISWKINNSNCVLLIGCDWPKELKFHWF